MINYVMARQAEWFQELPAALEALKELTTPVIDRATLERLLRIHRRTAIRLMQRFGGYQAGKTFLISRPTLIRQLERVAVSDAYLIETGRRERLSAELDRTRRLSLARAVRIDTAGDRREQLLKELPLGIHLKPGELRIEFSGAEDLLRRLYELSQAIVYDFARFRDVVEDRQPETPLRR
jgi:Mor family transcriptional regulator